MREEIAGKAAEGKSPAARCRNQFRLTDAEKLDENAGKLHDAIVGAPGMTIAAADREPGADIEFRCRIEITNGVYNVVEAVGHPAKPLLSEALLTSLRRMRWAPVID